MLDVIHNLGWIDCNGLMLGIVDCRDGIETLSIQVSSDNRFVDLEDGEEEMRSA